jgi:hypothetical protein
MDAALSKANGSAAYGEVVWSWRRDAGAKSAGSIPLMTVTTSPLHRGEHEVSRKAVAQGMSECFRSPVCSCAPNAQFLAHETAGAACTRHSLRPLFKEGHELAKPGRKSRRGIANMRFLIITPESGVIHIPETLMGQS